MRKFVTFILVIVIVLVWNQAAFGCSCGCIEEVITPETTVEETVVEEEAITEEEPVVEETTEKEVITEEKPVVEETTEECEAFEATIFDHSANYGDYMAFDYVEEVVEEEPTVEEATAEEIPVVEETPVIEETVTEEEAPAQEETPVVEQVQQTAVAALTAVEETVEETVAAAKPVVEQAKTAYVQTGADVLVSTFITQLAVMLAAIVALSVLLKYAVKQNK